MSSKSMRVLLESLKLNESNEINRLKEIKSEMDDLLYEAERIIRSTSPQDYEAARVYWIAHIKSALESGDSSSATSMQDTIDSMSERTEGSSNFDKAIEFIDQNVESGKMDEFTALDRAAFMFVGDDDDYDEFKTALADHLEIPL